jgi:hypothetical protein
MAVVRALERVLVRAPPAESPLLVAPTPPVIVPCLYRPCASRGSRVVEEEPLPSSKTECCSRRWMTSSLRWTTATTTALSKMMAFSLQAEKRRTQPCTHNEMDRP